MLTKRSFLAGAAAIAGTIDRALAQANFPVKTMRVIVGYAAGGGVDIVAGSSASRWETPSARLSSSKIEAVQAR